jgi:transketolase
VVEIDGHDFDEIVPALAEAKQRGASDKPTMVVAHTTKGHGLSFTSGKYEWHSKVAKPEELNIARAELGILEASK